ncbi:pyridoxamine 5'-phosphate oxidase family protein [Hungatella effluvii]|uniref:pyridoxamine 5'-phosphate oxidase family protein n=1 Tax=Hungatella effluvii TaxID=1096246 RepID=UPI002A820732|nr:pyridoxamine 5'-phosphate oxidase family protein [Hungatella effluvii]
MFNESFIEVLNHEGVVSVTSWANEKVHVANTWNSYLFLTADNRILIPAAWFNKTQKNVDVQNKVIVTLGSHEVQGKMGMGTGFAVDGTAKFLTEGADYDMMKEKYSFLTRVLEITPEKVRQTI